MTIAEHLTIAERLTAERLTIAEHLTISEHLTIGDRRIDRGSPPKRTGAWKHTNTQRT